MSTTDSSLRLDYVAVTDMGLRRSTNQDSGYASRRLIAVADGMGGAAAGDLASAETISVVRELDRELPDLQPGEALERTVNHANERLGDLVREDPLVEGMGTTLEAMLWDGERFATAHIGDSRCYLLRGGELVQVSIDHTFVQSLVDEGKLTPDAARNHPHRSLLLRVMLGRDDNQADLGWFDGELGDRFLLCSDGLSDMVPDQTIEDVLGSAETIDFAATELVRLALEAGGYDNVTVVIGELNDAAQGPDPAMSCANGQPQLVGAAADGPRPRTEHSVGAGETHARSLTTAPRDLDSSEASSHKTDSGRTDSGEVDPEEVRYAPQPPSRWRWPRRLLIVLLLVGIIAAGLTYGYRWSQQQYFVAESEGKVTIYRGIQADVPGLSLHKVEEVTPIETSALPSFTARQVAAGIEASSLSDAQKIVDELQTFAEEDQPEPSPSPRKRGKGKRQAANENAGSPAPSNAHRIAR